jgi:predicted nucleic acid-binding protein
MRIAAILLQRRFEIALSLNAIVVTRNQRHFDLVPKLAIADRTI